MNKSWKPFQNSIWPLFAWGACFVQAGILSHTVLVDQSGSSGGGTLNFPQFDPRLGTLDTVTVRVEANTTLDAVANVTNPASTADTVSASLHGDISVMAEADRVFSTIDGSTFFHVDPTASVSAPFVATTPGDQRSTSASAALQA